MRSEPEVTANNHNNGIRIGIEVASHLAKVYASDSYLSLASNGDYCAASTTSSSLPSPTSDQVPHVPICIEEQAVIEGAKRILQAIRPHWDQSLVVFKVKHNFILIDLGIKYFYWSTMGIIRFDLSFHIAMIWMPVQGKFIVCPERGCCLMDRSSLLALIDPFSQLSHLTKWYRYSSLCIFISIQIDIWR